MSGIQEILLIVFLIVVIWFLPRLGRRGGEEGPGSVETPPLTGRVRLAILISAIWIGAAAAILSPWHNGVLRFSLIGLGPVALGWGLAWVVLGFRKRG